MTGSQARVAWRGHRRPDSNPNAVAGLLLLLAAMITGPAEGATRDQVITYLANGWRVFDPAIRADTLFRACSPKAIYWDTTERYAEYLEGGRLCRIDWEMGAQPWPLLDLPSPGIFDWWFNPDSLCWQAAEVAGVPRNWSRGQPPYGRCCSNLWQSDLDGIEWHIARTDTADCGGCFFCETWRIKDSTAVRRHEATGWNQIQSAMTLDRWGGTPVAIPPPIGEPSWSLNWLFIPFRSATGRGLALRIGHRSPTQKTLQAPLYLMDRARGTQRLLDTPWLRRDEDIWPIGMAEHDGVLLVSGIRTYVFDLSTGEEILHSPGARGAIWIKRPSPAEVDTVGLRRLRERFR
jgi:hypothetical protein